jgi:mono/diheme cytochrome c family protein
MKFHKRPGMAALAIAVSAIGCLGNSAEDNTGSVGMALQIAPGITISTVSWKISNVATGFVRTDSVNVRLSNTLQFLSGGIPVAAGYTITLTAMSVDGAFTCTGSAGFNVASAATTPVGLTLSCSTTPPGGGTIVVTGTTQICANLDSIGALPLETTVNGPISLSATGSAGSITPTFSWTATAGTFDNAAIATPTFTCPATPGSVTISVTASPSAATCTNVTSQNVIVTCDAVTPTFTNVYTDIVGVRCIGCHKPGSSGVTVGMLDMSSQAAAYANLVGVTAKGIGAGTSGITCASVMPALVRVTPNDAANSLLFNKVHSKLVATPAPCGSPMPLPSTALALTAAEVDLVAAWINAGAQNN